MVCRAPPRRAPRVAAGAGRSVVRSDMGGAFPSRLSRDRDGSFSCSDSPTKSAQFLLRPQNGQLCIALRGQCSLKKNRCLARRAGDDHPLLVSLSTLPHGRYQRRPYSLLSIAASRCERIILARLECVVTFRGSGTGPPSCTVCFSPSNDRSSQQTTLYRGSPPLDGLPRSPPLPGC